MNRKGYRHDFHISELSEVLLVKRILAALLTLGLLCTMPFARADVDYESDYEAALKMALNDLTSETGIETAIDMLQQLGSYRLAKSYLQYLRPILDLMAEDADIAIIRIRIEACGRNAVFGEELAERGFPSCGEILDYIAARELESAGEFDAAFEAYAQMAILDAPDRMQRMIEVMTTADTDVSIRYVDTKGVQLDAETAKIPRGEKKTFTARTFDGYYLSPDSPESVTVTVDTMGRMSRREVVFTYRSLSETVPVTAVYRAEDGTELDRETVQIECGGSETFTAKAFEKYELTEASAAEVTVTVNAKGEPSQTEAVFTYRALPEYAEVTVIYKSEDGTELEHDTAEIEHGKSLCIVAKGLAGYGMANGHPVSVTVSVDQEGRPSLGEVVFFCRPATLESLLTYYSWEYEDKQANTVRIRKYNGTDRTVVIPYGVTSIDNWAFNGSAGVTAVSIPDSVRFIGYNAFSNCTGLTAVTIGAGITSIGDAMFSGCVGLTAVTIPDSVTSIGPYAFYGCTNLTDAIIPDSVAIIGELVFQGCPNLTVTTDNSAVIRYCKQNGVPYRSR